MVWFVAKCGTYFISESNFFHFYFASSLCRPIISHIWGTFSYVLGRAFGRHCSEFYNNSMGNMSNCTTPSRILLSDLTEYPRTVTATPRDYLSFHRLTYTYSPYSRYSTSCISASPNHSPPPIPASSHPPVRFPKPAKIKYLTALPQGHIQP